ncbi:hypothetical protein Sjap_023595 [Stephania japonica]|uniref:Poly [ADP-ribose] polymerase n=1 Tax=Stephania japonica TaxID=461633 RepID=A0AAP0HJ44_9MAGN
MMNKNPEHPLSDTGSSVDRSRDSRDSCDSRKYSAFKLTHQLITLDESNSDCIHIKKLFSSALGPMSSHTQIKSVHKNSFSSHLAKARLQSFKIFSEAVAAKSGGDAAAAGANVKYAWFGGSKEQLHGIVEFGFSHCSIPYERNGYGHGLYMFPQNRLLDAIESSMFDEDGVRHVLLCRVILGKLEVVVPGSRQFHPSSGDFDSGVDTLENPNKYIVWSTNMHSHVLPEFVVSFKAPFLNGCLGFQEPVMKPKSPWMSFPALISMLAKYLPPNIVVEIEKFHAAYRAKRIARHQLVQHVRQLAGDRLLLSIIKSNRGKEMPKATRKCH